MTPYSIVYITCRDRVEARQIGLALLKEKLAACVNILGNINSLYPWDGNIADETETLMIVKTRQDLLPQVVEKTKAFSSYSVPCVVSLPVTDGHKEYLDWLGANTK